MVKTKYPFETFCVAIIGIQDSKIKDQEYISLGSFKSI